MFCITEEKGLIRIKFLYFSIKDISRSIRRCIISDNQAKVLHRLILYGINLLFYIFFSLVGSQQNINHFFPPGMSSDNILRTLLPNPG